MPTYLSVCSYSLYNWQQSPGPPVKVICVVAVQFISSVSGGVTSFTLRLHHLSSSMLGLLVFPLLPLHVIRRRPPDAVSLVCGAAAVYCHSALLAQRLGAPMVTAVSRETIHGYTMLLLFIIHIYVWMTSVIMVSL